MYARAKRGSPEIVAQILKTARGGAIKTHIMFKARLSYNQLEGYTALLVENGLLKKHVTFKNKRTTDIFETSAQGEEFLRNYRTLELCLRA